MHYYKQILESVYSPKTSYTFSSSIDFFRNNEKKCIFYAIFFRFQFSIVLGGGANL